MMSKKKNESVTLAWLGVGFLLLALMFGTWVAVAVTGIH